MKRYARPGWRAEPEQGADGPSRVRRLGRYPFASLKTGAAAKAKSFDMLEQARKMLAVYEQAIEDKKANRTIKIDMAQLKAKLKERSNQ
jgi:hypothetical protein